MTNTAWKLDLSTTSSKFLCCSSNLLLIKLLSKFSIHLHMDKKCSCFSVLIVSLLISFSVQAQPGTSIPRDKPESEGVSSAGIIRFLDAVGKSKNEFHSFIFLRHGRVIAEGWWDPYKPNIHHTLYSASKTFTSTAVGFALSENRLKLSDKVISFFPYDLPDSISPNLAMLTIQDVLMMSDGMDPDPSSLTGMTKNWIKGFLATPVVHKPGSVFLYNSLGTFMLSAIVQKVTGQKLIDYLKPRLFDPLGIIGMDWEENMMSINTGGWGLRLKTEDMAKLGQLYLQRGVWNGVQLLSASWVEEASTQKIIQHPGMPQIKKDSSDWEQGYGYQIWRSRHHSYRADGAFGQYILVLPDQDAVLAVQSETSDMQNELNLVWDYLLPAIKKDKLPEDPASQSALKDKLARLSLSATFGSPTARMANNSVNKYFILDPNENHIETLSFHIKDSICQLIFNSGNDSYNLFYGAGFWKIGQTNKPGPLLVSAGKENWALLSPYKVAGNYFWKDEQTLVLQMRYIESPHTETTTLHFKGPKMSVEIEKSLDYGSKKIILTGFQK
jgi:CubicO group peptidase (beta-lactamase class C family)